jgi:hypothetical protein
MKMMSIAEKYKNYDLSTVANPIGEESPNGEESPKRRMTALGKSNAFRRHAR